MPDTPVSDEMVEQVAWDVGDPLFCGECEKQTAVLTDNDLCAPCSARLYPQPRLSIWDRIITALTGGSQ